MEYGSKSDEVRDTRSNEVPDTCKKRTYQRPKLERLGKLRELTKKFGPSQFNDSFCNLPGNMTGTRCAP